MINDENNFKKLIEEASNVLGLSQEFLRDKYKGSPICLLDYFEKEVNMKSIEIRFDNEKTTLTCYFGDDGKCSSAYLFPDQNEYMVKFVDFLTENHDYSFLKSRFMLDNCYLKIQEIEELRNNTCLMFYQ